MNWSSSGPPGQLEVTDSGRTQLVSKAKDIANVMNNFFVTKVQKILVSLNNLPPNFRGCWEIMNGKNISLSQRYISVKKVRDLLMSLKNKTSTSFDQLDNYAMVILADFIAEPLH